MGEQKRIGILTSGGDCAGLNAAIRAVVHRAVGTYNWEVVGILRSTQGLMSRPPQAITLDTKQVDPTLTLAGTMLGTTNKGNPFAFPMPDGTVCDRSAEIIEGYHQLGLNALIGIGGDGSLAILRKLANLGGIHLVGNQEHRLLGAAQQLGNLAVGIGNAFFHAYQEEDEGRFFQGQFNLLADFSFKHIF